MRARSSYSGLTMSHGRMMRSLLFIPYSRPQEHVSLSLIELTGSQRIHLCQGMLRHHHILIMGLIRAFHRTAILPIPTAVSPAGPKPTLALDIFEPAAISACHTNRAPREP